MKINIPSHSINICNSYVEKAIRKIHMAREERIKLAIKPKPKWLPEKVHKWILSKLLVMEKFI